MASGKLIQKKDYLQASEKHFTLHFPSSASTQGWTGSGVGLFRGCCSFGEIHSLRWAHPLPGVVPGSRDCLVIAFSLVLSNTRRWPDNHLEAHFLTLVEMLRNFLTRSKYLKGFISDLQLQYSSLPTLLFSTLKTFSQRPHHLCWWAQLCP